MRSSITTKLTLGKTMITTLTKTQNMVFNKVIANIKYNLSGHNRQENIEDRFISLSGQAGSGKSYLVAQITKQIIIEFNYISNPNNNENLICITAPTHQAVQVVEEMTHEQQITADCKTLHSFLGLIKIYDNETGEERYILNRNIRNPPKAAILIVDESSMVSKSLFNFILEAVQANRVNTVLFVGDYYQLPPVRESESSIFRLKNQNELTEIVRQAQDSEIIQLATQFRDRIATQNFIHIYDNFINIYRKDIEIFNNSNLFINDFCKNDEWYKENKIIASYTNNDVDNFNYSIRTYFWNMQGVINPDYILQWDKLRFKNTLCADGFSANSNAVSYQNGEEVIVETATLNYDEFLDIDYWKCTVSNRDNFYVIDPRSQQQYESILDSYKQDALEQVPERRSKYWNKYYQLKNSFADVQYAFASTLHKLQGSTYDVAYIDVRSIANYWMLSDNMKYRLLYVAITRARHKIKILL
jgi:exodeoxyribonuclease-5